ncbi:3-phosphoshikimate 1-carboxyvinyltransferase [Jeotgalibaca sp. A127]|uniref:3-phosphoshikimate 1-carboxyvinyltransferase n=1 Tax=Jeotgalibaca sp. A127 TaxID=3457324 RepID=UPI003FD21F37
MTDLLIKPSKLSGTVNIPPSKSMAHRAIIAACLAKGKSVIDNIDLSDDIIATIEGMKAFGAEIEILDVGTRKRLVIEGVWKNETSEKRVIDANESGSTLRFFIPIATLFEGETRFVGRGKLGSRPMDTYEKIFNEQGLLFKTSGTPELDLIVSGRLSAGRYEMAGNVSSQFITGLLFTLPLLAGDSVIAITTELESIGYLELTLEVLREFGISVTFNETERRFEIPGNQSYHAHDYTVEGDYSQAAFFLSAGALGNDVAVTGLKSDSNQGDKGIMGILEQLGAEMKVEGDTVTASAPNGLSGDVVIDGAQVPDIIPVSALVACLSAGETQIINLKRLRIKESDRLEATKEELAKLGADIRVVGEELHITGVPGLKGDATGWSHKDHRMAMMLAIASTVSEKDIVIKDAEYVSKSYPTFWQEFEALGGQVSEWNLGK